VKSHKKINVVNGLFPNDLQDPAKGAAYMEGLARSGAVVNRRRAGVLTCPRCRLKVDLTPTKEKPCPECRGF
jgi:hypothetical protein